MQKGVKPSEAAHTSGELSAMFVGSSKKDNVRVTVINYLGEDEVDDRHWRLTRSNIQVRV
jgi:hypothetical protein